MIIEEFEPGRYRLFAVAGVPVGGSSTRFPIFASEDPSDSESVIQVREENGRTFGVPMPREWLDREVEEGGAILVPAAPHLERSLHRPVVLFATPSFLHLETARDTTGAPLRWYAWHGDFSVTIAEEEEIQSVRRSWLEKSLKEVGRDLIGHLTQHRPPLDATIGRLRSESAYVAPQDQKWRVNVYLGAAFFLAQKRERVVSLWEAQAKHQDPGLAFERFLWQILSLIQVLELEANRGEFRASPSVPGSTASSPQKREPAVPEQPAIPEQTTAPAEPKAKTERLRIYSARFEFDEALEAIREAREFSRKMEIAEQLAEDSRREYKAAHDDASSIWEKKRNMERVRMPQEDLLREFGAFPAAYLYMKQAPYASTTGPRMYVVVGALWDYLQEEFMSQTAAAGRENRFRGER